MQTAASHGANKEQHPARDAKRKVHRVTSSSIQPFVHQMLERDESLVAGGHKFLAQITHGSGAPDDALFDARLMLGEALSNALRYGHRSGKNVLVHGKAGAGSIVMVITYRTDEFNAETPEPKMYAEGGYGIRLIKGMAEEGGGKAEWRFRQGVPCGSVTVFMVKKWDIELSKR